MADSVIRVEKVSKKYCRALRRSLIYGAADIMRELCGLAVQSGDLRKSEFWALDDISFELNRGQSLGVVGSNGSGKTTLLKLLSGVFPPDRGKITIDGRVGALLELGAGFHPLLSGRENVFIKGMILGMTEREIRNRLDSIVDFAEIGDFIDAPVGTYSSGMQVRLGFAVAIHADVDVLLVDEVLSVGDLAFAQKCRRKIVQFSDQGGTVVLVTHRMKNVKFVCDQALWLEKAVLQQFGATLPVVSAYEHFMAKRGAGDGEIISHDPRLRIERFHAPQKIKSGEALTIEVDLDLQRPVERPIFNLHLFAESDDGLVVSHHSDLDGFSWEQLQGRIRLRMTTRPLALRGGDYRVTFSLSERDMNNQLVGHFKRHTIQVENQRQVFGVLDARIDYCVEKS